MIVTAVTILVAVVGLFVTGVIFHEAYHEARLGTTAYATRCLRRE